MTTPTPQQASGEVPPLYQRARELCAERHDQPSNWQPCYFCFQDALAEKEATR